jgi:hypothetical protein
VALPASYDEQSLAEYLHTRLDEVAVQLGWAPADDGPGSYQEIVNDVLLALGTDDLEDYDSSTQLAQVRAVGLWKAWQAAADALVGYYDVSEDLQSIKRSQMQKAAQEKADHYRDEAGSLGVEGVPIRGQLTTFKARVWDPYRQDLTTSTSEFGS